MTKKSEGGGGCSLTDCKTGAEFERTTDQVPEECDKQAAIEVTGVTNVCMGQEYVAWR